MLINFTTKLSFIFLFILSLVLAGCYEEPTIEPVKRPYSSVRVGNFSYNQPGFVGNIDQFEVYVDGELKATVGVNTLSDYFDLPSGDRSFVLKSSGTTIYDNEIAITSYEEISLIFDGVYAPSVDTLMSFAPYAITDGYVYTLEAPRSGKANVLTSNFAPNTDTENQIKYSISFNSTAFDTLIKSNIVEYNKTIGVQIPIGDYQVWVLTDTTSNPLSNERLYDTLGVTNVTFSDGMKENLFIVGNPGSPVVIKNQQVPLVVRPK